MQTSLAGVLASSAAWQVCRGGGCAGVVVGQVLGIANCTLMENRFRTHMCTTCTAVFVCPPNDPHFYTMIHTTYTMFYAMLDRFQSSSSQGTSSTTNAKPAPSKHKRRKGTTTTANAAHTTTTQTRPAAAGGLEALTALTAVLADVSALRLCGLVTTPDDVTQGCRAVVDVIKACNTALHGVCW